MSTSHLVVSPSVHARWFCRPTGVLAVLILLAGAAAPARAALISVDFNSNNSPTQTGAAVVGAAGDVWNGINANPANLPATALLDSTGVASGVTLSYVNPTVGTNVFDDTNNSFAATPFQNLMRDYIVVSQGNTATLTLGGLAANTAYDLILYSNPNQGRIRTTRFTVNGISQDAASLGTDSTFINGVNYVEYANATSDALGNLVISFFGVSSPNSFIEGNLNGLQIQLAPPGGGGPAVPLPPAVLMGLFTGGAALMPRLLRRRRNAGVAGR